jgi:aminopeptidase S
MQPEDAADGQFALITDGRPGSYAGSFDVDNGVTTIRSPNIDLTNASQINLSFSYFFAHLANASNRDHLRIRVIGTTRSTIFKKNGTNRIVEAEWKTRTIDISQFAGQTIYLLIQAADRNSSSLVEAGIDNITVSLQ